MSVLAGFTLTDPPRLLTEAQLWEVAAEALGPGQILDLGLPKARGEFLAAGLAFSPEGKPATGLEIMITVGSLKKALFVFGDRTWEGPRGHGTSPPKPFTMMPLTWERAFGGQGYEANPDGCGLEKIATPSGLVTRPRPNFEYPGEWTSHPDDRPRPAGFSPLGLSWGGRLKNLGDFGVNWLRDQWPGLPGDFNWDFFNLAPADQRLQGYFKGNEPLEVIHLHPTSERLASRLPGVSFRLECTRQTTAGETMTDLAAHLDTIWLWPHLETGALIWHAKLPVADEEASEVVSLEAHLESPANLPESPDGLAPEPPPPPASVRFAPKAGVAPDVSVAAMSGGIDAKEASAEIQIEDAIPADDIADQWPAELAAYRPILTAPKFPLTPQKTLDLVEAEKQELQKKLDDLLRAHGVDPASPLDVDPPAEFISPPFVSSDSTETTSPQALLDQIEQEQALLAERLNDFFKAHGVDPDAPLETSPQAFPSMEEAIAELKDMSQAPPEAMEALTAMQALARQTEQDLAGLERQAEKLAASDRPKAPPEAFVGAPINSRLTREEVLAGYAEGRNFQGLDLSGLDLSGCRLDGIRLAGAVLEKTDFGRSSLKNAEMSGALLAGANLVEADLSDATLKNANATGVRGVKTLFRSADLTKVDFTGADLSQADMSQAGLKQADFSRATLTEAQASSAQAVQAIFRDASMEEMDWTDANLSAADFSQARVEKANFTRADLSHAWMDSIKADGALFKEANLRSANAQDSATFQRTSLAKANLTRGYFSQVDFSHADFSGACMEAASFLECTFAKASLKGANARRADFSRSDLSQANLSRMDLAEGSLRQARLCRTDLSGTNLFAVDFYKSRVQDLNLAGANLKRTLLKPWPEQ